jgi:hypothetical protein
LGFSGSSAVAADIPPFARARRLPPTFWMMAVTVKLL